MVDVPQLIMQSFKFVFVILLKLNSMVKIEKKTQSSTLYIFQLMQQKKKKLLMLVKL